jgi:hypothetical protein
MPEDADERKKWKIRTWASQVRIQGFQDVDMFDESETVQQRDEDLQSADDLAGSSLIQDQEIGELEV